MTTTTWLRADDCPLLLADYDSADLSSPRRIQRLLEVCLIHADSSELTKYILEEVCDALGADHTLVVEATPDWPVHWQFDRRGMRSSLRNLPRSLLSEVLDRDAGSAQPPGEATPAFVAAIVDGSDGPPTLLLAARAANAFSENDLEYTVAAAHYLGMTVRRARQWRSLQDTNERLETLVEIGQQLVEQRETIPLLEHIAKQATRLLHCERASIFLWDQSRGELVGRPALGLPGGELRIADDVGVVGSVVRTGKMVQVDDVHQDDTWDSAVDDASGFKTRSLLCIPLSDKTGQRVGALEVMNTKRRQFSAADVETLQALGRQTVSALASVQEHEALLRSNAEFEDQARQGCRIIGDSMQIKELRNTLKGLARTNLPVLVLGESGTGKDVVARALHFTSQRANHPFVPINCAAIAESLLESELFGHERGAFTGADSQRAGKFEAASGGTLFLDEVGDLSAGGQAKLLRVLEEKVVYRVGGTQAIPVDVRIIAATNRNLGEAVQKKQFREDLFYRLSVVTVKLPPLRDRRDDVLLLAEHFLRQFCQDAARRPLRLSADAKKRLLKHSWPGNVRELRNMFERVAYLCPNDKIESGDLPFIARPLSEVADDYSYLTLAEATKQFQAEHIKKAIERSQGHMSEAADRLGLHRPNLYRKMRLLNMDPR